MAAQRLPPFLGRSNEREVLDRLLDDARKGRSAVLMLVGEAGIGKTALLRYAARQASGFRLLQIPAVEAEMELAYAGLHQLCAPMLDQLEKLPEPQRGALSVAFGFAPGDSPDRFLIALAALSLLSAIAEDRPLLCLVDDVQWLDDASAQALGFVARRLRADRVAIVATARERTDQRLLTGLQELRLEGLEVDDARALLGAVIPGRIDEQVRDRIVSETRGNPLAIVELSRGMSAGELAGGFGLPDAGDLSSRIEDDYVGRARALPEATQRLMLLAAADPIGDASLLWRAAEKLDIGLDAATPAATEQLLEVGARVRFRHPLVRSAVYRAAPAEDRRVAHGTLAAAIDAGSDQDRRAWHRAHAVIPPDDRVATELIECAAGAKRRGGVAAAAAFLERAVTFTRDPSDRASRALSAAQAKLAVADFAAVTSLLASAEAGSLDELGRVQLQRMRAELAFDLRHGSDAPSLLLRAAQQLEPLDAELARETYLEALLAAIYASHLANGTDVDHVAHAARKASLGREPVGARGLLLRGLAARLIDGYAAAAPILSSAVRAYRAEERQVDWLCVAYNIAAMDVWDDEAWFELASAQAELARATGTLILLPYALDYLAGFHVDTGELSVADGLIAEAEGLDLGTRAETLPYIPLRLAAWRGQASTAVNLLDAVMRGAQERGEGCAIAAADYSAAILHNGLGQYDRALDAARRAVAADDMATSSWALCELVEAASRSGRRDQAHDAMEQLSERTDVSRTAWAKGTGARSRALVEDGGQGEDLHREAIEWLERCRMKAHLARARLSFGEWLRRENRRLEAREQLRVAYDMLVSMGADGFAERARQELVAAGEKMRKHRDDMRHELTLQEEQIARLARDGCSNPEIAAELFISARTVEWHLRKVFTKLGISSRKELHVALPAAEREAEPAL